MKETFDILKTKLVNGKYGAIEVSMSEEHFKDSARRLHTCWWVEANAIDQNGDKDWLSKKECGSMEEAEVIFHSYRDRAIFVLANENAFNNALEGRFWEE